MCVIMSFTRRHHKTSQPKTTRALSPHLYTKTSLYPSIFTHLLSSIKTSVGNDASAVCVPCDNYSFKCIHVAQNRINKKVTTVAKKHGGMSCRRVWHQCYRTIIIISGDCRFLCWMVRTLQGNWHPIYCTCNPHSYPLCTITNCCGTYSSAACCPHICFFGWWADRYKVCESGYRYTRR